MSRQTLTVKQERYLFYLYERFGEGEFKPNGAYSVYFHNIGESEHSAKKEMRLIRARGLVERVGDTNKRRITDDGFRHLTKLDHFAERVVAFNKQAEK